MLSTHKDFRRHNKANAAVQGTIFGHINLSCIQKIKSIVIDNDKVSILDDESKKTIYNAIDTALASNEEMVNKFVSSQTAICSRTCVNFAQQQYNLIKNASFFNENINNIPGISSYIINDSIIKLTRKIFDVNQSGMYEDIFITFHHFDFSLTSSFRLIFYEKNLTKQIIPVNLLL